jgi:acyl carrier protein
MSNRVAEGVHDILHARNGHIELSPDLSLGASGVGLDSIAIVEVLLECEELFGVAIAGDALALPSLTVGSLIEVLQVRVQR